MKVGFSLNIEHDSLLRRRGHIVLEKKYQIFISSTYTDLIDARTKVRDAILSMNYFPVGMEFFGAANEEQWQIISETIDSSDYYVLIVGQRYGSVIPEGHADAGISYTEKEFRYALEKGVPILAFLLDDNVPVTPAFVEKENLGKLAKFKEAVTTDRLVEWWKTPDELAQKVTTALYKQIPRTKRPGWIRGDSVDIGKSLSDIVELSEQNRELQEENKRLTLELEKLRSVSERKPLLAITLGCTRLDDNEDHLELFQRKDLIKIDEDGTVHLKLIAVSTNNQAAEYQSLSRKDVPADITRRVTDQELREYNASLPTKEALEQYLNNCRIYSRKKENGIPITFFVNNLGTAKATDISVRIELPDQVRVIYADEAINISVPKAPPKGENPIQRAYRQIERERACALDLDFKGPGRFETTPDLSALVVSSNKKGKTLLASIKIEDNIVEIEREQGVVHTKTERFNGAYIYPLAAGEYEAKVTFMCAEYERPEKATIKFIVEE